MLLNGRQGISAEMALRLAKAFKTSASLWLNLQNTYDLWHAAKNVNLAAIKPFRSSKGFPSESSVLKEYIPGS